MTSMNIFLLTVVLDMLYCVRTGLYVINLFKASSSAHNSVFYMLNFLKCDYASPSSKYMGYT
jgi:hypothetical protein